VDNNFSILLPSRAMTELARILSDDESRVEISVTANKSQALFKTETVNFTSSLIEGNFPNYQQIIPKSYTTRTVISTQELSRAVKQASYFAKDSGGNIVRVSVAPGEDLTPGSLTLSANAAEVGDNRSEIDATVDGSPAQIAFNAKYMADVLSVLTTGQVAIELQTPANPGVIKPVGKDDYVHVIMPMHLANR
jgi:DNA polymerase-3 subunit beta